MSDGAPTDLRTTAHLMVLDPGLFCVFNAPGAALPDPQTGLPGVRLSPAPAAGAFGGRVSFAGFSGDGWLAVKDDATLVRVTGGPAQVLVTIYQAADSAHAAPQLQVLRLSEPARTAPPPAPASPPPEPVEAVAHIYARGDVPGRIGDWIGERGSKRWIEGFAISPLSIVPPADFEYQAVLGREWLSPWAEAGQFCGSRGMSLPILGLRVRLRGASAESHSVAVSASFIDGTSVGPVLDGEACEAPSLAALEAFRVALQPKLPATATRAKRKR